MTGELYKPPVIGKDDGKKMNRDVLSELASGGVVLEEIEDLYNKIMDSDHSSTVPELLGMSWPEWTAFGHGVGFEELARWRAVGWPACCPLCGNSVPLSEFGWLAREEADGTHRIVHIKCL